jgi:hypothetical protein
MFPLPAPCSGPCWPPASSSACRCHLKAEHVALGWLSAFRIALLAAGCLGSAWLTFRLVFRSTAKKGRKSLAGAAMLLSISLMATLWTLPFFIW